MKWVTIASSYGLSSVRHQATTLVNVDFSAFKISSFSVVQRNTSGLLITHYFASVCVHFFLHEKRHFVTFASTPVWKKSRRLPSRNHGNWKHGFKAAFSVTVIRQNGHQLFRRHFQTDLKKIKLFEFRRIKISLKCVPKIPLSNKPIMAWRRIDDKPLSEPIMAQFTDTYMRHLVAMSFKYIRFLLNKKQSHMY